MIIKVENLPNNSNRRQVKKLFKKHGKVSTVLKRDSIAFVRMKPQEAAQNAIKELDGKEWGHQTIKLSQEEAKPTTSICRTEHGVFNLI